jgi:hypothetical protein
MAKKQRIDLLKKVYSKSEYLQIIDTSFNQFGTKSVPEQLAETTTVNDFFQDYNNLFYEIPALGDNNSHQYLIKTSAAYIDYESNDAQIEALQQEITQLRKDLLTAQINLANAITSGSAAVSVDDVEEIDNLGIDEYNNLVSDLGDVTSIAGDIATTSGNTNVSAMTPGTSGTPSSPKPVGKSMTSY